MADITVDVINQNNVDISVIPPVQTVINVSVPPKQTINIDRGQRGPQGPQGPQGQQGISGTTYTRIASGSIGGQRFVVTNGDGTVSYASNLNDSQINKVFGITLNAANDGENVNVLTFGLTEFNGWSWNTALPIFLGDNGLPTQTVPLSGFSLIVGFAETPTNIFVDLREPIYLEV